MVRTSNPTSPPRIFLSASLPGSLARTQVSAALCLRAAICIFATRRVRGSAAASNWSFCDHRCACACSPHCKSVPEPVVLPMHAESRVVRHAPAHRCSHELSPSRHHPRREIAAVRWAAASERFAFARSVGFVWRLPRAFALRRARSGSRERRTCVVDSVVNEHSS